MTFRNLLFLTASLSGLALAQDDSMCVVRTTIIPVVVTTTVGGPATTSTLSGPSTVSVIPVPAPSGAYNLKDSNGNTYIAQNNTGATGSEITYVVKNKRSSQTIMECINVCSEYANPPCVAAVLDNSTACHYFSSISGTMPESNFTFAIKQGAVIGGGGSSISSGSSGTPAPAPTTSMTPVPGTTTISTMAVSTPVSSSMITPAPSMSSSTTSSVYSILSTGGVSSFSDHAVQTVVVEGPPQTSIINTFSTVTQTSTQYAGTSTVVASTTVTSVSTSFTATSVVTVTPTANAAFAVNNKLAVGGDPNVLTITVTAEPTPGGWLW